MAKRKKERIEITVRRLDLKSLRISLKLPNQKRVIDLDMPYKFADGFADYIKQQVREAKQEALRVN